MSAALAGGFLTTAPPGESPEFTLLTTMPGQLFQIPFMNITYQYPNLSMIAQERNTTDYLIYEYNRKNCKPNISK